MGSPPDEPNRNSDEVQHRVTISKEFWLGQFEVTQEQWSKVVGNNPSHFVDPTSAEGITRSLSRRMASDSSSHDPVQLPLLTSLRRIQLSSLPTGLKN
jgi:formylglycine-generating enzyme required for sulfatase activity